MRDLIIQAHCDLMREQYIKGRCEEALQLLQPVGASLMNTCMLVRNKEEAEEDTVYKESFLKQKKRI